MNLNDLLEQISRNAGKSIEVQRVTVHHGNIGGAGDYEEIILTIGDQSIRFKRTHAGWVLNS